MTSSISEENYLGIIFRNRDANGFIKPNVIAEKLKITNAAVTDMLRKMARRKLVLYRPYKPVAFTSKGEQTALRLIRRHRIWEVFLSQVVGMDWEQIHDEAERLEHYSSETLIDKLEELLNFPRTDPHGHQIPDKNGNLAGRAETIPLSDLAPGTKAIIAEVNDCDPEFLRYIRNLGLNPGKVIEITDKIGFDGSLVLNVDGNRQLVSTNISTNIYTAIIKQ